MGPSDPWAQPLLYNLTVPSRGAELLEARGVAPLLDLLRALGGWPALEPDWDARNPAFDWLRLMAELRLYNNDILVAEWVGPDVKNSDVYVIQLDQTGLGLPTRDYFLTDVNAPYLNAYRLFIVEVMQLLGASATAAATHSAEIVAFETHLAKVSDYVISFESFMRA